MLLVRTRVAPSAIHGRGLFARDAISEGEAVWHFHEGADLVLPPDLADQMCRPAFLATYGHSCPVTGKIMICLDDARFINHSWTPNLTSWAPIGLCMVNRAVRDIAAGEELTIDYRVGDAYPWRGFNKEEAINVTTGSTGVTEGDEGMAGHGKRPDGRHHGEHR